MGTCLSLHSVAQTDIFISVVALHGVMGAKDDARVRKLPNSHYEDNADTAMATIGQRRFTINNPSMHHSYC